VSNELTCGHDNEADVSTWGDMGRGVQVRLCLVCGESCEVPHDWVAFFGRAASAEPDEAAP
jgi:hypothetical protein